METFCVSVYRKWLEHGVLEIEAENAHIAKELAEKLLKEESKEIQWYPENLENKGTRIESVWNKNDNQESNYATSD